jgi:hypothetical protein
MMPYRWLSLALAVTAGCGGDVSSVAEADEGLVIKSDFQWLIHVRSEAVTARLRAALVTCALAAGCGGGAPPPAITHVVKPGQSIQAAIDLAQPGEVVLVYPGTYTPAKPDEAMVIFTAQKNGVTLRGAGKAPDEVVLDGSKQVLHVLYFAEGIGRQTVVENLTVTGGLAYPATVLPPGYVFTLRPEIDPSDDFYHDGAGVMLFRAAPTVRGCRVLSNDAQRCGAGISVFAYASSGFPSVGPLIQDCEITGNKLGATDSSGTGGGIDVYNGARAEVINSLLAGNNGWGAIAVLDNAVAVLDGLTFADNSSFPLATSGSSTTTLSNSIFAHNGDDALHVDEKTITYDHCAFWANGVNPWTPPAGRGHVTLDPLFVKGPRGAYYLAEPAAGQPAASPCVDAGDAQAAAKGLATRTTRTDGAGDTGVVDLGYHYLP